MLLQKISNMPEVRKNRRKPSANPMLVNLTLKALLDDIKANFATEYSTHQKCRLLTFLQNMNIRDESMLEELAK